jgi:hypothetical protein
MTKATKTEYEVLESVFLVGVDVELHRAEFHRNCLWMTKFIVLRKELECWNIVALET